MYDHLSALCWGFIAIRRCGKDVNSGLAIILIWCFHWLLLIAYFFRSSAASPMICFSIQYHRKISSDKQRHHGRYGVSYVHHEVVLVANYYTVSWGVAQVSIILLMIYSIFQCGGHPEASRWEVSKTHVERNSPAANHDKWIKSIASEFYIHWNEVRLWSSSTCVGSDVWYHAR